jgi:hypothetical protein
MPSAADEQRRNMSHLTIAKPAFGTLEGFQKIMSAQAIGQGEPEGLQARYVADVGDGIRVVAVWESKQHADRFLEQRLAPALATAFDERQGHPQVLQGEVANSYTA